MENIEKTNTVKTVISEKITPESELKIAELVSNEISEIIPPMPLDAVPQPPEVKSIVSDESLLGLFGEILDTIREDRNQAAEYVDTLGDMVINGGDASDSSKEAFVTLFKAKSDMADKMAKIADLMTRIKLKEPNTYKPFLNQTNNINIASGSGRRGLIDSINKEIREEKQ